MLEVLYVIILGIDPGVATVGFGVLKYERGSMEPVRYGVISTPAGDRLSARLSQIYHDMLSLIDAFQPDVISVEELFFNTNITTGIRVAEARGVILMCAEKNGVKVFEYTPLQVKQAVVGYGRAEKKQVITMVTFMLGLKEPPKPDDTADALAIAVCHAHTGASRIAQYYNK